MIFTKCTLHGELLKIYNKNTNQIKQKIINVIESPLTKSESTGWIYGFYRKTDNNTNDHYWIKIGRTDRNPFIRVQNEWNGNMLFCIKSNFNHRLEYLCHLFLDYSREHRYSIHNINQENTNNIENNNNENKCSFKNFMKRLFCCYKKIESNSNIEIENNSRREIEWFHFTEKTNVVMIVSLLAELVENIYDNVNLCDNIVNINKANKIELSKIPYIGKNTATKIIQHRKNNKITCKEDLEKVNAYIAKHIDVICQYIIYD